MACARSSAQRSATSATTTMADGSRRGSVHTVHGFCVSMLPQTRQISIFSIAVCRAAASGAISASRFLIRNSAARRAERGPSPGKRASSWIRRSISGPAATAGITISPPPCGEGLGVGVGRRCAVALRLACDSSAGVFDARATSRPPSLSLPHKGEGNAGCGTERGPIIVIKTASAPAATAGRRSAPACFPAAGLRALRRASACAATIRSSTISF